MAEDSGSTPRERSARWRAFLGFTKVPGWLNFWVPIIASIFSLVIAVYGLIVATEDPEVVVLMPRHVIMDDADAGADVPFAPENIFLQLSFVGTGNNNRIELISSITLRLEPEAGGPSTMLEWAEQGDWDFVDPLSGGQGHALSERIYVYRGDAAPLLVGPNNAQQLLCVFPMRERYVLTPGVRYRLTLTAERVVAGKPLAASGLITVSAEEISYLKSNYRTQKFIQAPLALAGR